MAKTFNMTCTCTRCGLVVTAPYNKGAVDEQLPDGWRILAIANWSPKKAEHFDLCEGCIGIMIATLRMNVFDDVMAPARERVRKALLDLADVAMSPLAVEAIVAAVFDMQYQITHTAPRADGAVFGGGVAPAPATDTASDRAGFINRRICEWFESLAGHLRRVAAPLERGDAAAIDRVAAVVASMVEESRRK